MEDNKVTLRDLIELARAGEAADFTSSVQDVLSEKVEIVLEQMLFEEPEEDEEEGDWDFDLEDDIDDLEEEELAERNALNHQKSRAFRAGVKEIQAKQTHVSDKRYMSRHDKWSGEADRKIEKQKAEKTEKAAAAKTMFADAQKKGVALGGKTRSFSKARDAGKDVRTKAGIPWNRDTSTVAKNARIKDSYGGEGRFAADAKRNKHMKLKNAVDHLNREISNHLSRYGRADDENKYGDSWRLSRDKGALEPHHFAALNQLHSHLKDIHDLVKKHLPEELDLDLIEQDLMEMADDFDQFVILTEGKTWSRESDNEDMKMKGGAKRFSHRQFRRKWKSGMDEGLELRDDLTDEELFDLAENITEDDFELLSELSKEKLGRYMGAADDDIRYGHPANKDKRKAGMRKAGTKWLAKEEIEEDEEQLDELSKAKLGRYMGAADDDIRYGNPANKGKRKAGMRKAGTKWLAKEEAEDLEELSKSTLKSYIDSATDDVWRGGRKVGTKGEFDKSDAIRWSKRSSGIRKAADKLSK